MSNETKELALTSAVAEALLLVEELKAEAEGWRRRNLILDTQMERQERVLARLEAIAGAWEAQLGVIADLDRLDVQVKKLTGRILQEAAGSKKDPWESVS